MDINMSQGTTVSSALQQTTHALYGNDAISHRQPAQRCCETGRPIATDPVTGSIVCSCQIQPGSQSYLSRVPRLPEHIYGPTQSQIPAGLSGIGQPAFYSMDGVADRRSDAYAVPLAGHAPYFYDQIMAAQQYGAIPQGFDFNAARRKNATRETTGPLKAWLNGHRKNPYPTKGEKVMLAIITRMTLTQVSTWFANARRRLKKENVFGDDDFDSDDKSSKDDSVSSQNSLTEDDKRPASSDTSGISDISDVDIEVDDVTSRRKPSKKCVQRLFSPDIRSDIALDRIPSPEVITNVPTDAMKRLNSPLLTTDNSVKSDTLPPLESFAIFKDKLYQSQLDDGQLKYDHSVEFKLQKESGKRKLDETDIAPTNAAKKPKIWSISEIIG